MAADTLTRVFSALADPTRRDIVVRLAEGEATVGQLAEPYRMTLQAVYKHLRVLEDAGLVSRPHGPQPRPVRLETEALLATMSHTDDKDGADDVNDYKDGHRG